MQTRDFFYHLPPERIAQVPLEPREDAKLLVLSRDGKEENHYHIRDLPKLLRQGDLLVFNETKVFRARLLGTIHGRTHEVFMLRGTDQSTGSVWQTLVRGSKSIKRGDTLKFGDVLQAEVLSKEEDGSGVLRLQFPCTQSEVVKYCETHGSVPTPPYVTPNEDNTKNYQTIYAKHVGSVAAPTAGFHFTESLLQTLKKQGVETAWLTLHVGIGTFQPVKTERLEDHPMHAEEVDLPQTTVEAILRAKQEGRRVIAIGTTTVRTLEGVAKKYGELQAYKGDINLFITPGFEFKVIDGLLTNFHLPCSTLLALVSAFAGRERILKAYEEAIKEEYRFFSFGDAMLII